MVISPSPRRTALPAMSSRPLSRLLGKRTSAPQRDGTTAGRRQQARKGGKRGRLLWEKIHRKRYTLDLPTTMFITFFGGNPLFTNIGHGYWVGGKIDMQECQLKVRVNGLPENEIIHLNFLITKLKPQKNCDTSTILVGL